MPRSSNTPLILYCELRFPERFHVCSIAMKVSKGCISSGGFYCVCIVTLIYNIVVYMKKRQEIWPQYAWYFFHRLHCISCIDVEIEVTSDDQVKAYIKKIMSQLNKWMISSKISKLVVVITSKETGETVERWQFDVSLSIVTATCTSNEEINEDLHVL